jgi:hypothetical protein
MLSAISSEWSTCFCSGHLGPRGEFTAGVMCAVSLGTIEVLGLSALLLPTFPFKLSELQACTIGLTGKSDRWCFDACKVSARCSRLL